MMMKVSARLAMLCGMMVLMVCLVWHVTRTERAGLVAVVDVVAAHNGSSTHFSDGLSNEEAIRAAPLASPKRKRRVAVTVVISGNMRLRTQSRDALVDGACVLQRTMRQHAPRNVSLEFIGLVSSLDDVDPMIVRLLTMYCGFSFRRANTSTTMHAIRSPDLRRAVSQDAAGITELLKLESLLMPEYDLVVSVDPDLMFVGPFDDLLAQPKSNVPFRFTEERGVIVFFPRSDSQQHVAKLLDLFVASPYSHLAGYAEQSFGVVFTSDFGTSGSPMLHGLLPFYVSNVLQDNPSDDRYVIDKCRHSYLNSLAYEACDVESIGSVRFYGTLLPAPWSCPRARCNAQCFRFHKRFTAEHVRILRDMPNRMGVEKVLSGCADDGFYGMEDQLQLMEYLPL